MAFMGVMLINFIMSIVLLLVIIAIVGLVFIVWGIGLLIVYHIEKRMKLTVHKGFRIASTILLVIGILAQIPILLLRGISKSNNSDTNTSIVEEIPDNEFDIPTSISKNLYYTI